MLIGSRRDAARALVWLPPDEEMMKLAALLYRDPLRGEKQGPLNAAEADGIVLQGF